MPQTLTREVVEFERLDAEAQSACIDEIHEFGLEVFEGKSRDYFEALLFAEGLVRSRILMLRDAHSRLRGLNLVRRIVSEIDGRPCDAYRATAALAEEYRGGGSTLTFGFSSAFAHKLRNPMRSVYYLGFLHHPSSYYVLAKHAYEIWPSHKRNMPIDKYRILQKLSQAAGVELDEGNDSYSYFGGSSTRQTPEETEIWRNHPSPEVQLFLRLNPKYEEGYGLATLIPLTWTNLVISGARFSKTVFGRKLGLSRRSRRTTAA